MRTVFAETGGHIMLDPHTAVGVKVARQHYDNNSLQLNFENSEVGSIDVGNTKIILATAHPVKFPESVAAACDGQKPAIPAQFNGNFL